jgi:aspartokinase
MTKMSKIELGGVKTAENQTCLYLSCAKGAEPADPLLDICSTLASARISMEMLTYVADNGLGESITSVGALNDYSFSSRLYEFANSSKCETALVSGDFSRISVFPHDQRPGISASLIEVLNAAGIKPYGICSSPSAVTVVVSSLDFEALTERFFHAFVFSTRTSFSKWLTSCRLAEKQLREEKCLYDERVIGIYGFTRQTGLDLWNVTLPTANIAGFGTFLLELDKLGFSLPFLVSSSAGEQKSVHFSFTLDKDGRETAKQVIDSTLPCNDYLYHGPVSVILLHGPHFGDRYGIAHAFVSSLRNGNIPLLALSCAISSVSAVIDGDQPDLAVDALSSRFQTPLERRQFPGI